MKTLLLLTVLAVGAFGAAQPEYKVYEFSDGSVSVGYFDPGHKDVAITNPKTGDVGSYPLRGGGLKIVKETPAKSWEDAEAKRAKILKAREAAKP